jgi:release factor glutamine methyltransferase
MTFSQALQLWHRHEALLLLSFITGYTRTEILLRGEQLFEQIEIYINYINQRKNHVPLQYIMGQWDFMGLTFKCDARALIPRPETELLAELVMKHNPRNILELCTGSGCLAVTWATLCDACVTAVDICVNALDLAKENAVLHGVGDKINFIQSDLFENVPKIQFDCIVANPPYIPTGEISALQSEVKNHEPMLALDGGYDGLEIYRRLIPESLAYLSTGGLLFLEIGPWEGVTDLMRGFATIETMCDYNGIQRVVYGGKC